MTHASNTHATAIFLGRLLRASRIHVVVLVTTLIAFAAVPAAGQSMAMHGSSDHSAMAGGPGHEHVGRHVAMHGTDGMFEVGSPTDPLITRMDGRLPFASVSRRHLAASRGVASRAAATSSASVTLGRRCKKLIARRRSTLSRRERTKRRACVLKRRQIAAAKEKGSTNARPGTATPNAPTAPGVTAPAPAIKGPDPVVAPPAVPTPTPITGAPAPTPTPGPGTSTPSPVYAAVGVKAIDGGEKFQLSRTFANADVVNFELVNTDSQQHDLWIAAADAKGDVAGAPVQIIGRTNGQVDGTPTRAATDMKLAPGKYVLICTVPGHGKMTVGFTVYAPTR